MWKTEELAYTKRHNNRILNEHGSTSRIYNTVELIILESKLFSIQSNYHNRLLLDSKFFAYLEMYLKIYQNQWQSNEINKSSETSAFTYYSYICSIIFMLFLWAIKHVLQQRRLASNKCKKNLFLSMKKIFSEKFEDGKNKSLLIYFYIFQGL